jgi:2-iminobutanoate/2-iminopropanoate deaminase
MMMKNIFTENAPKPIGPYSQAIIAGGMVFVSGQLGLDPVSGKLKENVKEQALQACQNLKSILEKAGSGLENVAKTTVFLSDMNDFATVNEVYQQFFKEPAPARSAIQVTQLPQRGLVEIEAIAFLK